MSAMQSSWKKPPRQDVSLTHTSLPAKSNLRASRAHHESDACCAICQSVGNYHFSVVNIYQIGLICAGNLRLHCVFYLEEAFVELDLEQMNPKF